ncbi:MAG: lamin tail domain-containing protein, partial [Anaerolineales bacterium]|nr:lamin tail domain-containing protein [Anaerolineales bacterium]
MPPETSARPLRAAALALALGLAHAGLLLGLLAHARPSAAASAGLLLSAVYYDTYLPNEPDEAWRLTNAGAGPVDLAGWTVTDQQGTVTLSGTLAPGASLWVARTAVSFTLEFGFPPAFEYGGDSDPAVPDLARAGTLSLSNSGDRLLLQDAGQALVDSVVWESGPVTGTGWLGPTIAPYDQGFFGLEGQILYRKLDQATGRPFPDTDQAGDWAQASDDDVNGKKVFYPGWDQDLYFQTYQITQTAALTYLVAPDHIFPYVLQAINAAAQSIRYEGYDFKNAELGQALAARAAAGVSVTVLLEGAPVGGLEDQERWNCQQIEAAGGACWFMFNDAAASPPIHDRYAYQHAKFMLVDDRWLLTGSENLNYSSMPSDSKTDGTAGNRGLWLWTDAAGPLAHVRSVFEHDLDPQHHR